MLRLGKERELMNVVDDQIGRPTYAPDLAQASLKAAIKMCGNPALKSAIYHVSNAGVEISWAKFADSIFSEFENDLGHKVTVKGIPSSEYPTPATRPAYSVMDIETFEKAFNYSLPSWRDGLSRAAILYRQSHSA